MAHRSPDTRLSLRNPSPNALPFHSNARAFITHAPFARWQGCAALRMLLMGWRAPRNFGTGYRPKSQ